MLLELSATLTCSTPHLAPWPLAGPLAGNGSRNFSAAARGASAGPGLRPPHPCPSPLPWSTSPPAHTCRGAASQPGCSQSLSAPGPLSELPSQWCPCRAAHLFLAPGQPWVPRSTVSRVDSLSCRRTLSSCPQSQTAVLKPAMQTLPVWMSEWEMRSPDRSQGFKSREQMVRRPHQAVFPQESSFSRAALTTAQSCVDTMRVGTWGARPSGLSRCVSVVPRARCTGPGGWPLAGGLCLVPCIAASAPRDVSVLRPHAAGTRPVPLLLRYKHPQKDEEGKGPDRPTGVLIRLAAGLARTHSPRWGL